MFMEHIGHFIPTLSLPSSSKIQFACETENNRKYNTYLPLHHYLNHTTPISSSCTSTSSKQPYANLVSNQTTSAFSIEHTSYISVSLSQPHYSYFRSALLMIYLLLFLHFRFFLGHATSFKTTINSVLARGKADLKCKELDYVCSF